METSNRLPINTSYAKSLFRKSIMFCVNNDLKDKKAKHEDGKEYLFLTSNVSFNEDGGFLLSLYFSNDEALRKEYLRTRSLLLLNNYTNESIVFGSNHSLNEIFTGFNLEF